MNIFCMVSYKSLGFGALILGIKLLLIIMTFLQILYIYKFFQYFLVVYNTKKNRGTRKNKSFYFNMTI